jgi:hypothetical protein
VSGLAWQEATREQFIQAERGAGFYPKSGSGVATGGFSGGATQGRVTYGEITEEKYARDPEFVAIAKASSLAAQTAF